MAQEYPWFRGYSRELLNERKIARITREIGRSYAEGLGVWMLLLSLANESPIRGRLLIDDELPMDMADLSQSLRLPEDVGRDYIEAFCDPRMDMLGIVDGVMVVLHWDARQPASDGTSAGRKQDWRNRRSVPDDDDPQIPSQGGPVHVPTVSQDCPAVVPTMSQDCPAVVPTMSQDCPAVVPTMSQGGVGTNLSPDIEEEGKKVSSSAKEGVPLSKGARASHRGFDDDSPGGILKSLWGDVDPPQTQWPELNAMIRKHGAAAIKEHLRAARRASVTGDRALPYVAACLKNSGKEGQAVGNDSRAGSGSKKAGM